MKFIHSLHQVHSNTAGLSIFSAQTYPAVFFSLYIRLLRRQHTVRVYTAAHDYATVQAALCNAFLGQQHFIWLGSLEQWPAATRKKLYLLLAHYAGPHNVLAFSEKGNDSLPISISLPETIDKTLFSELYKLFFERALSSSLVTSLFNAHDTLSFDAACTLMMYVSVLGRNVEYFLYSWFPCICVSEISLFKLSQAFFKKDNVQFARLWKEVRFLYAEEFWRAFWFEQLWQALVFCEQARAISPQEARRFVRTLPFSFTQHDWRRYTQDELAATHHGLYTLDRDEKSIGNSALGLDVLLFRFLNNDF